MYGDSNSFFTTVEKNDTYAQYSNDYGLHFLSIFTVMKLQKNQIFIT